MEKLSREQLHTLRTETRKKLEKACAESTQIIVGMGTSGIAAGAREVMDALLDELSRSERDDVRVVNSGCMGMCSSEPNVTVEVMGHEPVIYQHMDQNKMRQVFQRHILRGEVQTDFALARMP